MLTLGFVYSAMMRGIPFLIVKILKSCLLRIGFKKRNGSVFAFIVLRLVIKFGNATPVVVVHADLSTTP